ncbi:MAG: hypothetical protein NC095_03215 [Muribaculum sp.]|nr:hypothetical protein [Muribaculum sp.]
MKKLLLAITFSACSSATIFAANAENNNFNATDNQANFIKVGDALVNATPGSTTWVTQIDENGNVRSRLYSVPESEEMIRMRKAYVAGQTTYPLTIKGLPDSSGANAAPSSVFVMKDKYMYWKTEYQEVSTFDLPAGTYDIQVIYDDYYHSIVAIPNVELNGPIEKEVCLDMADKLVSFKMYLHDGNQVVLPTDGDPSAAYNIPAMTCLQSVMVNGSSQYTHSVTASIGGANSYKSFTLKSNFGEDTMPYWHALTYVSQDYGICGASVTADGATLSNGQLVENRPSDFMTLETSFEHTPIYDQLGGDNVSKGVTFNIYRPDGGVLAGLGIVANVPTEFHICAPDVDFDSYHSMAYLRDLDVNPKYGRKEGVHSPVMGTDMNGEMYYFCTQEDNPYDIGTKAWRDKAPYNPYFSYPYSNEYAMGSTSAYVATIGKYVDGVNPYFNNTVAAYYGNYGDLRVVDGMYYEESAAYNGEPVDLSSFRTVNNWLASLASESHDNGEVAITYTDNNIRVADLDGSNVCTLTYTEGKDDVVPPTIQRLMISDANGNPTIYFDNAEEGKIMISGGDFTPKTTQGVDFGSYTENITTYDYAPAEISVEYAPYASDDFSIIEVKEDQEKYVQSYGGFWEGCFDGITKTSDNGWFDLKVTLTDASGNTQSQIISPAFYIKKSDTSGVMMAETAIGKLYVENGKVVSSSNSAVQVYSPSGKQLVNANLTPGIYIAVDKNQTKKIIVK